MDKILLKKRLDKQLKQAGAIDAITFKKSMDKVY